MRRNSMGIGKNIGEGYYFLVMTDRDWKALQRQDIEFQEFFKKLKSSIKNWKYDGDEKVWTWRIEGNEDATKELINMLNPDRRNVVNMFGG